MTRSAGRAVDSNARASSKLIRVPPRLVAPAGCTWRDEANSRLRFCDVRRSTMLASRGNFSVSIAARRRTPLQIVAMPGCSNLATLSNNCAIAFSDFASSGQLPALAPGRSRAIEPHAHSFNMYRRVACRHPAGLLARESHTTEVVSCAPLPDFLGQRCGARSTEMLRMSVENAHALIRIARARHAE